MLYLLLVLFNASVYGSFFTLLVSGVLQYMFKDDIYYEDQMDWWNNHVGYVYMVFFTIMSISCVCYLILK